MTVDAIRVVDGGEFRCKLSESSKLRISFTGTYKIIEVEGGVLELVAAKRFSWTRLEGTVEHGATKFTV
jgi:hypothetical protein